MTLDLTLPSRIFSAWKHNMGERRSRMGKKRKLDEVSIYTIKRIMKKFKTENYADYDSAVDSDSSSDDCDGEPAET